MEKIVIMVNQLSIAFNKENININLQFNFYKSYFNFKKCLELFEISENNIENDIYSLPPSKFKIFAEKINKIHSYFKF